MKPTYEEHLEFLRVHMPEEYAKIKEDEVKAQNAHAEMKKFMQDAKKQIDAEKEKGSYADTSSPQAPPTQKELRANLSRAISEFNKLKSGEQIQ